MAIFEQTEHKQATKKAGQGQELTPSPTEAKDAQAYFDEITKKEKANSTLPNLTFKTVARNNVYYLEEFSTEPNTHVKSVVEIGQFQEYTNGYKSQSQTERSITGADGKKVMRQTEQISTPTSTQTSLFEAPADGTIQPLKETYRRVGTLKDGKEVSFATANFGYSETGKRNAETLVMHSADGSIDTQVFGGEDLKLKSDLATGPDGKELERTTVEDILNDKKEVVGKRETVVLRNKDNTSTTTFEGPQLEQLKPVQQVIVHDNGKTETFKANAKGDLVLVKTP